MTVTITLPDDNTMTPQQQYTTMLNDGRMTIQWHCIDNTASLHYHLGDNAINSMTIHYIYTVSNAMSEQKQLAM